MMPVVKGMRNFARKPSPSDRNFLIPGSLMLDTDSDVQNNSKFNLREKMMNNSTTRNIHNKTIDVTEFQNSRKNSLARSNLSQFDPKNKKKFG